MSLLEIELHSITALAVHLSTQNLTKSLFLSSLAGSDRHRGVKSASLQVPKSRSRSYFRFKISRLEENMTLCKFYELSGCNVLAVVVIV